MIQNFFLRITKHNPVHGLSYETIYTYMTNIVQFGREAAELWAVLWDGKPVAFAVFRLCTVPHYGKVSCDYIFKSVKEHEPATQLGEEFVKFGQRHNAPYYTFEAIDESQARVFTKRLGDLGIKMEKTSLINLVGRKSNGQG